MNPTKLTRLLLNLNDPHYMRFIAYDHLAHLYPQLPPRLEQQADLLITQGMETLTRIFANPFTDQGRIEEPSRFFGRELTLNYIFTELAAGRNVSLVGEAQVGKSSVLTQVVQQGPVRLNRPSHELVYISMEWLSGDEDFFECLCSELNIAPAKGYQLRRALQGRRFIVCLDEFEKMHYQGFTANVRAQLRGLVDGNQSPLTLVVASRASLSQLFGDTHGETSPLANICPERRLSNFSLDEARQFIDHRLRRTPVRFTPEQIATLLRETQGHPGRLQQLSYELYQQYTI